MSQPKSAPRPVVPTLKPATAACTAPADAASATATASRPYFISPLIRRARPWISDSSIDRPPRPRASHLDLAPYHLDDVAAHPHVVAFLAQINPPGPLQRGALRGDIGRRREPGADQPLREARVQASGDRILVSAAA